MTQFTPRQPIPPLIKQSIALADKNHAENPGETFVVFQFIYRDSVTSWNIVKIREVDSYRRYLARAKHISQIQIIHTAPLLRFEHHAEITLLKDFWECECELGYIHPYDGNRPQCMNCMKYADDSPDARLAEYYSPNTEPPPLPNGEHF